MAERLTRGSLVTRSIARPTLTCRPSTPILTPLRLGRWQARAGTASTVMHSPVMHYPAEAFRFQPIREQDLPMLHEWLLRPHVAQWWGPAESVDELRQDYVDGCKAPNATRAYIASFAEQPIGFIQAYVVKDSGGGWWEDETDPGARGIDQFLADGDRLGQGLGRAMIRAFLDHLFVDPAVTVVQTDPAPTNARAIRCYLRAGFRPVGPVTTPDGAALLMRCARPGSLPFAGTPAAPSTPAQR